MNRAEQRESIQHFYFASNGRSRRVAAICAVLAGMIIGGTTAQGALYWDTNGTTAGSGVTPTGAWDNVSTNKVWGTVNGDGAVVAYPVAGDDVVFSAGTDATGSYSVNVTGTQAASSITFKNGIPTVTGGTAITLGAGGITLGSGKTATVNTPINQTNANSTWTISSGDLSIGGKLTPMNSRSVTYVMSPNTTTSILGDTGATSGTFSTAGSTGGTLVLGKISITGGVTLNGGTIQLNADGGLGTGTFNAVGGTLTAGIASRSITNAIALGTFTVGGSFDIAQAGGAVTGLSSSRTITVDNATKTDLRFSIGGNFAGSSAQQLIKAGGGVLALTGSSQTTTGTTTNGSPGFSASTGTLLFNGTATSISASTQTVYALGVASGATVGGTGSLGASKTNTGGFIYSVSGTVDPGDPASTGFGKLTLGSTLTGPNIAALSFNTGSTFAVGLGGATAETQYDQLAVNGSLNLSMTSGVSNVSLLPTLTYDPALGTAFDILLNDSTDSVTGLFKYNGTTLANGAQFTLVNANTNRSFLFKISYSTDADGSGGSPGNDVRLTVVPEPASLAVVSLAAAAALVRRRRRI